MPQIRPDIVMIKVYVKDECGNVFLSCIDPKKISALFWTIPKSVEDEILRSTNEQLDYYISESDKGNICSLPESLKADKDNKEYQNSR